MPIRIQRKRTRGWRMPEGAVYVGRPTVYAQGPIWSVAIGPATFLIHFRNKSSVQ
jgi:hypothetical protein